eukprot:Skav219000  [mRNA]  locus=scaffold169:380094:380939:+ [translate_table: standard]
MPVEKANRLGSDGRTSLDSLVVLLKEVSRAYEERTRLPTSRAPFGDFENFVDLLQMEVGKMAVRFVKEKLSVQTVIQTFQTPSDEVRESLGMLTGEDRFRSLGPRLYGFGAEFILALMEKGLPRWCWGGHATHPGDNLLQYVLKETMRITQGKTEAERKLCIELAKRLSLEELCNQDGLRRNALDYAVKVVDARQAWDRDEVPAWMEVRDTIRQQIEARVREFQGDMMDLVALTASVRHSLKGALSVQLARRQGLTTFYNESKRISLSGGFSPHRIVFWWS